MHAHVHLFDVCFPGEPDLIGCLLDFPVHLFLILNKSKASRGLRGLLCRWPSITEWEVHITAHPPPRHLQNDLYCVEWDVKP